MIEKPQENPRPSILLVDDDEVFRETLARAFTRRGYEVRMAGDAAEGLALARAESPEYAVVDLKMPGDSGLVLVRALAELDPQTRILVLTGFASVATAVEAIKLGATHYLAKPADVDEILSALHRDAGDPGVGATLEPPTLSRLEWEHIQRVLTEHGGNVSATARALKMHRRTLQRKLAKRPVRD